MKHALIVGGSGFVGQSLVHAFIDAGWRVTVFDTRIGKYEHEFTRYYAVDVTGGKLPTLQPCDVIINLAGATINHRFTPEYKKLIWSSRVISTRSLRQWVETQSWQPGIYIGACATGYYGNRGNEQVSTSTKPADDILGRICIDWEREHNGFTKIGIPVSILRQGHVLGHGGLIAELLPWYRYGLRLTLGQGDQFVPWIDMRDLVTLYISLATGQIAPGTYNAVSSTQIRFSDLARTLGRLTHAGIPLVVPLWALRLRLGECAEYMIASQRVQFSDALLPHITHTNLSETLEYCVWK